MPKNGNPMPKKQKTLQNAKPGTIKNTLNPQPKAKIIAAILLPKPYLSSLLENALYTKKGADNRPITPQKRAIGTKKPPTSFMQLIILFSFPQRYVLISIIAMPNLLITRIVTLCIIRIYTYFNSLYCHIKPQTRNYLSIYLN